MRPRATAANATLRARVTAGLAVAALSIASANGQEKPKKDGIRLGPFQVSAVAPFTAGVDGNVYNTPEAVADQTFTITPTLQVVLPLGRHARIISSGGIAPYYFHTEESQRHTDLFGRARAEVDIGPVTPFVGIEGGKYRQRFSLEIDQRIARNESGNLFGADLRLRRRVTLRVAQETLTQTFDPATSVGGQPVSVALDRDTQTRTLRLTVPLTRKTSLAPWIDFIEDRFIDPAAAVPVVKSTRYGAAFEFSELAFFNGRAAAGIRHFAGDGAVPPYDGPFLAVNLGMPFILGSTLQLNAGRDVMYSAIPSLAGPAVRQTYVASAYAATVNFELPWKLQGRILGGYDENKYLSLTGSDPGAAPNEHGETVGGALLRHLGRHLSLGGGMRYVNRKSAVPNRSYHNRLYGLTGDVRF